MYATSTELVVVLTSDSVIAPLPAPAGALIPFTTGRLHTNEAPGLALVGVYVKFIFPHIEGGVKLLLSAGKGFTVTTIIAVFGFVQPLADTVYSYVTFTGVDNVLVKTSFTLSIPLPAGLAMPPTRFLVQE